ncbi:hypothetical protein ACPOL_0038 [Acidisarcina polymorpha]|uniref:Uncharacterized protein n=1 Tax=Acidisarcina polymorpha TaxID=2211140 RepID=A0A2Z5FSH6_9BACT|nr:hypothetical protein [Acidisarcina polymorpha]AXC09425.1 hypothetical protein ACPOL_0038 [Acidisarcina polymorpha]
MGLEAAVYIKKAHISVEWLDETITVDETTGEVISETFHIPAKAKEAISYRLGNGKYIERCRLEIEKVAKGRGLAMPVLFHQVLSGEVQPGDVVKYSEIPNLKRELKFLERAPKFSADVKELLFRLNKLVEAAEANHNPIAFT